MPQDSKETLLVAHELADGSTAISQLSIQGKLLKRFGTLPGAGAGANEFRPHLAWAGGFLFRSNGVILNTISEFNPDGTLNATITPNTSPEHDIVPIAQDFAGASIYMVDTFAATNVIRHLDDPLTGASSPFATLQYDGIAGISDLYMARSNGSTALYAFTQTNPQIVPGGKGRIARIDAGGTVRFFDNPKLNVPWMFDVGSVAVSAKRGNIYVATTTEIVEMDESGTALGSFPFVDTKPSMDIAPNGELYAGHFDSTNGQVDVFNRSGKLLKTINVPDATRVFDILIAG
jgi:hypothetical protein